MTMGAFLHDSGKINELEYDQSFAYSDEGQLIGHLVMGIKILEDKATESEQLSGGSGSLSGSSRSSGPARIADVAMA